MREIQVVDDYDFFAGELFNVSMRGYKTSEEAYYSEKRRVKEYNRANKHMKVETPPIVVFEDGLYYPISKKILSTELKDYLNSSRHSMA